LSLIIRQEIAERLNFQVNDILKKVLMTQQEIADKIGHSQSHIHYILNGDRTPSVMMAVELEEATGICREAWLWPERHFNPYMPFTDATICMSCPNRITRMKYITGKCVALVRDAKDKIQALKDVIEIAHVCNGFTNDVTMSLRKVTPKGLELLAAKGDWTAPQILTDEMFPWGLKEMRAGRTVHVPVFSWDLSPEATQERAFGDRMGIRCLLALTSGKFVIIVVSRKIIMQWTPEIIERGEWFIRELTEIYDGES
jgi:plasmid maintenance system antidote protein VapI